MKCCKGCKVWLGVLAAVGPGCAENKDASPKPPAPAPASRPTPPPAAVQPASWPAVVRPSDLRATPKPPATKPAMAKREPVDEELQAIAGVLNQAEIFTAEDAGATASARRRRGPVRLTRSDQDQLVGLKLAIARWPFLSPRSREELLERVMALDTVKALLAELAGAPNEVDYPGGFERALATPAGKAFLTRGNIGVDTRAKAKIPPRPPE